jgi:hypothetical protein
MLGCLRMHGVGCVNLEVQIFEARMIDVFLNNKFIFELCFYFYGWMYLANYL